MVQTVLKLSGRLKDFRMVFKYVARGVYALFLHVGRSVSARFVRNIFALEKAAIWKILGFCASA